jgi:hypothetical protein
MSTKPKNNCILRSTKSKHIHIMEPKQMLFTPENDKQCRFCIRTTKKDGTICWIHCPDNISCILRIHNVSYPYEEYNWRSNIHHRLLDS